jgi:hypothetical protein
MVRNSNKIQADTAYLHQGTGYVIIRVGLSVPQIAHIRTAIVGEIGKSSGELWVMLRFAYV